MTISNTTSRLPFGALTVHRIVTFASEIGERYRTWAETRRTADILRRLDDDQLDDIGLTRGDIEDLARTGRF